MNITSAVVPKLGHYFRYVKCYSLAFYISEYLFWDVVIQNIISKTKGNGRRNRIPFWGERDVFFGKKYKTIWKTFFLQFFSMENEILWIKSCQSFQLNILVLGQFLYFRNIIQMLSGRWFRRWSLKIGRPRK